ncbi:MAG: hypothetical protein PUB93_03685 [Firmicutes bacterium]|nr:hypothetical protein [Bacillota bacterium]
MKKNLQRVLTLALAACLLVTAGLSMAQAADYWNPISGTTEWVAMDGNDVDGTPTPAKTVMGSNGLTITYTGGEYIAGGTNSGVMYALPVDINNFSVEFTVTKRADYYDTTLADRGCDSWISLCLLNQPDKYFNIKKAGSSQGIVTLIRPTKTHTAFEVNELTNSWAGASRAAYEFPGDMATSFKVEIKKGNDGVYDYIVNGVTVDFESYGGSDFSTAFTRLMEKGNVYFYMGVSSKDSSQQIEWRITRINGQAVKPNAAEPQPTETLPAEPKPTEPKPTEPKPTEPKPTDPQPTDAQPIEPEPTESQPMDPIATEPQPTDPEPTVTDPTEAKPVETRPGQTDAPTVPTMAGNEPAQKDAPWGILIAVVAVLAVGAGVVVFLKKRDNA